MVFRIKNTLLSITVLGMLSACVPETKVSSISESSFSTETSSESTSAESSLNSSLSEESSISSLEESSSSDDKVYYTVSIYQSYLPYADLYYRTGTRFDTSIKVEAGKPLYTTTEEGREFYRTNMHPVYDARGGAYFVAYLFYDEECTEQLGFGVPIESDSTFYYYLYG